jgi:replicative DNA helicase
LRISPIPFAGLLGKAAEIVIKKAAVSSSSGAENFLRVSNKAAGYVRFCRMSSTAGIALERGLPSNVDAERFVLGSVLLDDSSFINVAGALVPEDFSLEKHRKIFVRMTEINDRGERIDRVTVANELMRHGELESVDGLTYLVSLDDGLPRVSNLDSYVKIIKDKATLRRIISMAQQLMNRALIEADEPDQILAGAEESLLKLGESRTNDGLITPLDVIRGYEGGINAFLDPSKRIKGISTGFTKLDEMTGGLHPGELIILAARPSMGKTAFALNVAWHVATKLRQPVAIFSLEMSNESLLTRMLCASAYVDSQRFRAGYLTQEERAKLRNAANEMVEAPIYIDDTPGANLMDMHAKLRRLNSEQKLGLVIVDYLQLMSGRGRSENRNQEVSALSRGMKLLAKELGVPMLVLSQLSRATETRIGDHRPQLSDLRESGSIEQDADLVGFIFREEVYKRDREDLRGLAEFILAKQRNGPVGKIDMVFLHALTKFENRAQDIEDVPE